MISFVSAIEVNNYIITNIYNESNNESNNEFIAQLLIYIIISRKII